MDVTATWSEDYRQYVTEDRKGDRWFSEDGDWWRGEDGQLVETEEFKEASIKLVGGQRDGECVA